MAESSLFLPYTGGDKTIVLLILFAFMEWPGSCAYTGKASASRSYQAGFTTL